MKITYSGIKQIILYYSILLSTIIFFGGLFTIRTSTDLIVTLLFLPIIVYFFMKLAEPRKLKNNLPKNQEIKYELVDVKKNKKILESIGIFFIIWVAGGVVLNILQFGMLSGVIAFSVGIFIAFKNYK